MKKGTIFISYISHAREKLVPICHIFRTNILLCEKHKVKLHIAYMRIPHDDRIPQTLMYFTFEVLSLSYLTVKYQFVISVIIWYHIFHMFGELVPVLHTLEFYTDFFACDDLIASFHRCEDLAPINVRHYGIWYPHL